MVNSFEPSWLVLLNFLPRTSKKDFTRSLTFDRGIDRILVYICLYLPLRRRIYCSFLVRGLIFSTLDRFFSHNVYGLSSHIKCSKNTREVTPKKPTETPAISFNNCVYNTSSNVLRQGFSGQESSACMDVHIFMSRGCR